MGCWWWCPVLRPQLPLAQKLMVALLFLPHRANDSNDTILTSVLEDQQGRRADCIPYYIGPLFTYDERGWCCSAPATCLVLLIYLFFVILAAIGLAAVID